MPPRLAHRVRLAAATGVACAAVLTGCGGDDGGVSAETYASELCSSVVLWKEKLQDGSQVLAERLASAKSLREVKAELLRFFDAAIRETDVMLTEVRALEPPDVENGEESAAAVVQALERFGPILADTREKAQRLPLDDEMAFTTGAQSIGATYQSEADQLGTVVSSAVDPETSPELSSAIEDDPSCQRL